MKKLILFFIFGCMLNTAATAITYDGGAGNMSVTTIPGSNSVQELIVIGDIDARDFSFMKKMSSLMSVNLAEANIVEHENHPANEMPAGAFSNKTTLVAVFLPSNLTSVGESAFVGCSKLSGFACLAKLKMIGNFAFKGCTDLQVLDGVLSDSLVSIGNGAFYGCEKLTNTNIASCNALTTIGASAFLGSKLTGQLKTPANLTTIGDSAFYNCDKLTTLTLDLNVALTSIGTGAFQGCTQLEGGVDFPGTLTMIGDNAFYDCNKLSGISFAAGGALTSIGNSAFEQCSTLTGSIAFPAKLRTIGNNAFESCASLTKITFVADGALTSIGNVAFYQCTTLTDTIAFPASLETIGELAFYRCRAIKKITFPADGALTTIAYLAFEQCAILTDTIAFPASLKTIGESAFGYCRALKKITFPADAALTTIGESSFESCESLTGTIAFPASLKTIGSSAFFYCRDLKKITFASDAALTKIGDYAFSQCALTDTIAFPASLETIGDRAFADCSELNKITFASNAALTSIGNSAFYYCTALTDTIVFPAKLRTIGDYAFYSCGALSKIVLSDSLITIGYGAFSQCGLTHALAFPANLESIGVSAFFKTGLIETLAFPEKLNSIGDQAFESCTGLSGLSFPASLTSIGASAFSYCVNVREITFASGGALAIGHYAFDNLVILSKLELPDGLESIGVGAFVDCGALDTLTLPASLTTIGSSAFNGCTNLSLVINSNPTPVAIQNVTFTNKDFRDTCILRLPTKEAYSLYKVSSVWGEFKFEEYEDGLDTIILSEGTLEPLFKKHNAVYVYDVNVANSVDSIIIKAFPLDTNATISDTLIIKRLEVGTDSVKFTVTAQACNTQEYKIIITRRSRDSTLSSIAFLEQGRYPRDTLSPKFHPDSTHYRLSVGYDVDTVGIVGTPNHPEAKIDGHGEKIPLDVVGLNTVTITVTAEDGNTLDYIVEVTRRSNNAYLDTIIVSSGTLSPGFSYNMTHYEVSVLNSVDSVFITAPAEHPEAKVAGAGAHPNLVVGTNRIILTVTAEDGNTQNDTVDILRAPSNNANLATITLDGSTIGDFSPAGTFYQVFVHGDTTAIKLGAVAQHPQATVAASDTGTLSLEVGRNLFYIRVLAEDGTTQKTYTIEVIRPSISISVPIPGYNYKLDVSEGRLVPEPTDNVFDYTLVTPQLVDTIEVAVVPKDYASDSVRYFIGAEEITMPMRIPNGYVLLNVHVTLYGAVVDYYLSIYGRPEPTSNALLDNLSSREAPLMMVSDSAKYNGVSGFLPEVFSYTATVPNAVDSITLIASKTFDSDTVRIQGILADSARFGLAVGMNHFTITVTAKDKLAQKTYTVAITRATGSDAALSNLTVSDGVLSPEFDPDTLNYRDTVAFAIDSITLIATPRHDQATVEGGTTQRKRLVVGNNLLAIRVQAANGVWKTYNVSVYRRSNDSSLQRIKVSDGSLTPVFEKTTRYYTDSVSNNVERITLEAQASHANAVVTGDTGTHSLSNVGSNEFHITVTSEDGGQNSTYTINVYRLSNDAWLSNLTVSEGTLSPVFDINTQSYRDTVANSVTDITLFATPNHPEARIVSGIGTKSLQVGDNKFDIVVRAEDGTQKIYTVMVRRRSNDAKLGNLRILNTTSSSEVLDFQPVFNSETFEYHMHLRSYVERIRLDATARNEAATISGAGSKTLTNNVFTFSYSIVVVSEDTTATQTYVVEVSKDNPADATLKSLTSDQGELVPAFSPSITEYTLKNIPDIDQLRFEAEPTNDYAEVSGIGTQILQVGANVFSITVTAEDGATTKTYTVNVVRPDLSLRSLTLGAGLPEPKYNEATRTYSADVLSNVTGIDIKALPTDATAKVSGNGKEQLKKGSNSFTLTVTSADGFAVREYTLTVFRDDRGSDAFLKSLSVSVGRFTPQFRDSAFMYFLRSSVANDISLVTITAETRDPNATIESNLVDVALEVGGNEIRILVRAANKIDVQVYTVMIDRLPKAGEPTPPFDSLARLRDLRISADAGEFVPSFNPNIPDYTLPVNCATDSLTVTAVPHDSCTVMYIINEQEVQMPLVLEPGYTLLYIYIVRNSKYIARYSISVSRSLNMATIIPYWHDVLAVNLNPETNGGYEFTSFQWMRNGTPVAGETGSYWYNNGKTFSSGEYSIQVTTTEGKSLTTCPLTLVSGEVADISAYPNPTQSHVTVVTSESSTRHRIEIIDLKGNVQKSYPSSGKETSIDITGIPAGVYVVRVGQKTTKIVIAAEN